MLLYKVDMEDKPKYQFEDLVYVGEKLHFATPGKTYVVMSERVDDGGCVVKSFRGDDGLTHEIFKWSRNDIKFMSLSEVRDLKINKIINGRD